MFGARVFAALAVIAALAPVAADAKPKGCLSDGEIVTEQMVHHGVFLREEALRCNDYTPGTWATWAKFDKSFGTRLAAQTASRVKVFQREFPDDWKRMLLHFDGKLVVYYRNYPLTMPYCGDVKNLLDRNAKGGWGSFSKQAKLLQDVERLDWRSCTSLR